jgi:protein SCO1
MLAAAAISLVSIACTREEGPQPGDRPSVHDVTGAGETADGESIFGLDLALLDQDGQALQLADLRGDVMLAAMVYTSCTSVCLMVTEQMKAIEHQLAAVDADLKYVLFSLDPGRDTPEAMRVFLRDHRLDPIRWRLMAASEDGVRDLAAVLGVKYQPEQDGEIAHSAMIFVIDEHGVVRHRQVGVGKDSTELVDAVQRARR